MGRKVKEFTLVVVGASGSPGFEYYDDAEELKERLAGIDQEQLLQKCALFTTRPTPFEVSRAPTVTLGAKSVRKPRTRKPAGAGAAAKAKKSAATTVAGDFFEKPNGAPPTDAAAKEVEHAR